MAEFWLVGGGKQRPGGRRARPVGAATHESSNSDGRRRNCIGSFCKFRSPICKFANLQIFNFQCENPIGKFPASKHWPPVPLHSVHAMQCNIAYNNTQLHTIAYYYIQCSALTAYTAFKARNTGRSMLDCQCEECSVTGAKFAPATHSDWRARGNGASSCPMGSIGMSNGKKSIQRQKRNDPEASFVPKCS